MIARAAEVLGNGSQLFRRAGFTQMTTNLVRLAQGEGPDVVGVVEFEDEDTTRTIWSFVKTSNPAPRYDHGMGVEVRFAGAAGEAAVTYEISAPLSFEGILNGLVQSIKAEHERRFADCTDVWLTGFRNTGIPTSGPGGTGSMTLELELIRNMGQAPQFQTYWKFELTDRAGHFPPLTGATSFAYKLQGNSDVA